MSFESDMKKFQRDLIKEVEVSVNKDLKKALKDGKIEGKCPVC